MPKLSAYYIILSSLFVTSLSTTITTIYITFAPPIRAFTNGYFAFLETTAPSKHDLHLSVSVANPINPQFNHAAEWTYHLIIEPSKNSTGQ
jgi:hypothetical protein